MLSDETPRSKTLPLWKVGVLGATGVVGQRFLVLLSQHPWFEIHALAASPRSAGKPYGDVVQWKLSESLPPRYRVLRLTDCSVNATTKDCDFVFSALNPDIAKNIELEFHLSGIPVFSNASCFRMDAAVPLMAPTANPGHLKLLDNFLSRKKGFIVTNPNCSTTGLVVTLKALQERFGPIDKVHVVTLQAVSGAGYPGISSLDIFDNVIPFINGEEQKLEMETRKILGKYDQDSASIELEDIYVSATCNRVAVVDGHMLNVSVSFVHRSPPALTDVVQAFEEFKPGMRVTDCPSYAKPIHVFPENDPRPQPRLDRLLNNGMTVSVGRIRKCSILDIKFVALLHNTILGAAGSAILNAEIAALNGYFDK